MSETTTPKLAYGCRHLQYDPEKNESAWGARLIFREVKAGGLGLVADRTDAVGSLAEVSGTHEQAPLLNELYAGLEELLTDVRRAMWSPGNVGVMRRTYRGIGFAASCQGSGGYLYVTAVWPKTRD